MVPRGPPSLAVSLSPPAPAFLEGSCPSESVGGGLTRGRGPPRGTGLSGGIGPLPHLGISEGIL